MHARLSKIYNAFQDELSKQIFRCRLNYFLANDIRYLNKMTRLSGDWIEDKWAKARESEVVLFGTGKLSTEVLASAQSDGLRTVLFCDSDSSRQGKKHLGLPVISPEELAKNHTDKHVLISTSVFFDEVFSSLVELGFPEERVIKLGNFSEMYFGENFLLSSDQEIYLDVGCNNGDTIAKFFQINEGRYGKIYGMEPDISNYKKAEKYIKETGITNVELINAGAWSCNMKLRFSGNLNADSAIAADGNEEIEVKPIDSAIEDGRATFIKMDIEGAEAEAIKGAASIIRGCKPKLAICVYHKPEDIIEISNLLLEYVPDYKLYLRHHNHYPFWRDTVLYAI